MRLALDSACGTVDAVYVAADIPSRSLYICQHPVRGLSWAFHGMDLHDTPRWRQFLDSSTYDLPLGIAQYYQAHRLMAHEMRLGRYTFEQYLSDVRERSRH